MTARLLLPCPSAFITFATCRQSCVPASMYTLHCTKKLLDRVGLPAASSLGPPTTVLGNWYATALFWKPQVALFVNERTLLPLLMPLAPASSLVKRFPRELVGLLTMQEADREFMASEIVAMGEVNLAKTANRRVVGTMNEFAFLAEGYREYMDTADLLLLSMRLADTPCSPIKHNSPAQLIKEVLGASAS